MSPTDDGQWSEAEKAAMRERAAELRAEKGGKKKADALEDLLVKIEEMPPEERVIAQRVHDIVTRAAPELAPRTWYGMPAYAKDGKVLCFFQAAAKFESRYCTFGFQDVAQLDSGAMWPTAYAIAEVTDAVAAELEALVRRAVEGA